MRYIHIYHNDINVLLTKCNFSLFIFLFKNVICVTFKKNGSENIELNGLNVHVTYMLRVCYVHVYGFFDILTEKNRGKTY